MAAAAWRSGALTGAGGCAVTDRSSQTDAVPPLAVGVGADRRGSGAWSAVGDGVRLLLAG
ncbi:hypothetical protein C1N71_01510 [Agrococcus sp. SGAir0287]|nr:hypothetical protein C1N71_01510 [Agrococcus sp. SGAir0287]